MKCLVEGKVMDLCEMQIQRIRAKGIKVEFIRDLPKKEPPPEDEG